MKGFFSCSIFQLINLERIEIIDVLIGFVSCFYIIDPPMGPCCYQLSRCWTAGESGAFLTCYDGFSLQMWTWKEVETEVGHPFYYKEEFVSH